MKRIGLMVGAAVLAAGVVLAGSPGRATLPVSAGTTNAVGTGAVTLSFGSGIGFRPESVFLPALAGSTQTVSVVVGGSSHQLGSKVAAANDYLLWLTNAPWLFDGDGVAITTTATNGYTARVIGTMQR